MMELGSGIAIAGFCVSAGAVSITAIRTFANKSIENHGANGSNGRDGRNGTDGQDGRNAVFPCKEHSGIVACMHSIQSTGERHEEWLKEIAGDMKQLLRK